MYAECLKAYLRCEIQRVCFLLRLKFVLYGFQRVCFLLRLGDWRLPFSRVGFLLQPKSIKLQFSACLFPAISKQEGSYIHCLRIV